MAEKTCPIPQIFFFERERARERARARESERERARERARAVLGNNVHERVTVSDAREPAGDGQYPY